MGKKFDPIENAHFQQTCLAFSADLSEWRRTTLTAAM